MKLAGKSVNAAGKRFVYIFFIGLSFLFFIVNTASVEGSRAAPLGPCIPPATGDWLVSSPATCLDRTILMNGDVSVTGALELINVTLVFNSTSVTGYYLEADSSSILRVYNSTIKSSSADNHFSIFVRDNVDFSMVSSVVEGVGAKDPELWANETPLTNNERYIEYGSYFWVQGQYIWKLHLWADDGIIINSTVTEFRNNTIHNFTAIWIYSDNNMIEGNSFTGMKNHGLGFMNDSDGNRIIGNYFGYAARMNRHISGIKFMPKTTNQEIAYNTIEWVPEAITVAEIPPYTVSNNFQFHHNRVRNVLTVASVRANDVTFSNENYSDIYAIGIAVSGYYNVTIQRSTFKNLTFQSELESIINQDYFNECNARNLLPNAAFFWWVFYNSKAFVRPGGWGNLLVVQDNYFGYAPPYGNGIVFDGGYHHNFRVYDNTFEMIGNYIPSGFTVRKDLTGRVPLAGNRYYSGASISLEGIRIADIERNVFNNVVNGILTSTPDSLGTYGAYTIKNNVFKGVRNFTWQERISWTGWFDRTITTIENGTGVGIGTHGWGIPEFGCPSNASSYLMYIGEFDDIIKNNSFANFHFPVLIDFARSSTCELNTLGPKHAKIYNNSFFNYTGFVLINGSPSTIEFLDNSDVCEDMTTYGSCSVTQPLLCQNGLLTQNCSACGCPGSGACQPDGTCSGSACIDGTAYGQCSMTLPLFCQSGALVQNCSTCGCASGYDCNLNGTCAFVVPVTPCGPYDSNLDGSISQPELQIALQHWFSGTLGISDAAENIRSWIDGTCSVS